MRSKYFEGTDFVDVGSHYKTSDIFRKEFQHWGGFQYIKDLQMDQAG
jgi:hypothetical protein